MRDVPIHAELARILAAWKLEGWPRFVRRLPRPDDLVVPREDGSVHSVNSAGAKALRRHAETIGIDTRGAAGFRDVHSFRRAFVTLARTDGAPADIVERITHNARGEQIDGYTYFGWETLCSAVSSLRSSRHEGRVIELRKVASAPLSEHAAEHADSGGGANDTISLAYLVEAAGVEPASERPSR